MAHTAFEHAEVDLHAAMPVRAARDRPAALYRRIAAGMAVTDALCAVAAMVAAYELRFDLSAVGPDSLLVIVLAPVVWIAVFHGFSLYSPQRLSAWEEFRRVLSATSVGIVLVVLASYWSKTSFSRSWVGLTWVLALLLELAARRAWRRRVARLMHQGALALRTVVVGANDEAARLADALAEPGLGFRPVGHVATGGRAGVSAPVLGTVAELDRVVDDHDVDCLFVATTAVDGPDMLLVAQAARRAGIEVKVSANLPQILTPRLTVQPIGSVMALTVRSPRLTGTQAAVKRAFDLTVAGVALLLAAPVMTFVAVAIRATSPGDVLFRQARVTKGGRAFTMYKFRTMVAGAESHEGVDRSAAFFKVKDDPRLTRVGRFLRRFSLDELPQLLNVVKGDMSLVGPRPLPVDQVAANLELLGARHEVPSGITGWWQIQGRSDVGAHDAVRMDLFYIENWSLSLDLFILLKTAGAVLARRGAY